AYAFRTVGPFGATSARWSGTFRRDAHSSACAKAPSPGASLSSTTERRGNITTAPSRTPDCLGERTSPSHKGCQRGPRGRSCRNDNGRYDLWQRKKATAGAARG